MSWTTPLTAVANIQLTAAQWNASVRDNLNMTSPAIATSAGGLIVTNGANQLAERHFSSHYVDETDETTSTSYTDLAPGGPDVTLECGPLALVWFSCQLINSGSTNSLMNYTVSGATTDNAAGNDGRSLELDGGSGGFNDEMSRWGVCQLQSLTAGWNTFVGKYRVSGGTGTFRRRRVNVLPL